MTADADDVRNWMTAGGNALLVNVPMSPNRFEDLAAATADGASGSVVDFGCGRGAFAHRVAELNPTLSVHGIDTAPDAIAHAEALAHEAELTHLAFEVSDASDWNGSVDTATCFGSSHAFGDTAAMFSALHAFGANRAVIGDGFWASEPSEWCLENLGEMPRSITALADIAADAGWLIDEIDASTLDEWDAFERIWGNGVRSVGTSGALAFADERAQEYHNYRGVLGFAWLQLRRS